jgi:hypothetical protein
MHVARRVVPLTLIVVLASCQDVVSPNSTPPAGPQSPSLGASVTRFTEGFFRVEVDEETGLIAVFGLSHEEIAPLCAGQEIEFDPLFDVEVIRPDGSVKLSVQGQPSVTIYPLIPDFTDLCQLTEVTPLATGTVHFSHLDNDVNLSLERANSFGETVMGTVSGSGGRFQVSESFQVTILPSGDIEFRNFRFSITPIGA